MFIIVLSVLFLRRMQRVTSRPGHAVQKVLVSVKASTAAQATKYTWVPEKEEDKEKAYEEAY